MLDHEFRGLIPAQLVKMGLSARTEANQGLLEAACLLLADREELRARSCDKIDLHEVNNRHQHRQIHVHSKREYIHTGTVIIHVAENQRSFNGML